MTKLQDKQVRIERDFLGEKEVDTQAYYGIQTLRAVENFQLLATMFMRNSSKH